MESFDIIQHIHKRLGELKFERSTWETHWEDLQRYVLPFHGQHINSSDPNDENNGDKKHQYIIDGTGTYAINIFGAGMQSGMTNPAMPWFKLRLANSELAKSRRAKEWLDEVTKVMYKMMQSSGFYRAVHHMYAELACFGTAAVILYDDPVNGINCVPLTAGEYYISNNHRDEVDTFYQRFYPTCSQIVKEFGIDKVSDRIKRAYDKGAFEQRFELIRAIEPNNDNRFKVPFPYASITAEVGLEGKKGHLLKKSGFEEFPVLCPRWSRVARDVYGISPSMYILGDVKMLQVMQEKALEAIHKKVNPPIKTSGSNSDMFINSHAGGITYGADPVQPQGLGPLYTVDMSIQEVEFKIEQVQSAIRRGLYNDMFLMISQFTGQSSRMTATEVAERHEEKLMALGPAYDNLQLELLDPAINRYYNSGIRNELFPPPPPDIVNQEVKVEYVSLLAQAQKMIGLTGIEQLTAYVGSISAVYPEARHKLDIYSTVNEYSDRLGTPAGIIRPDEEAAALKEADDRAAQAAQQGAAMGQAAESAKVLSEAQIDPETNMLQQLMAGPQSG